MLEIESLRKLYLTNQYTNKFKKKLGIRKYYLRSVVKMQTGRKWIPYVPGGISSTEYRFVKMIYDASGFKWMYMPRTEIARRLKVSREHLYTMMGHLKSLDILEEEARPENIRNTTTGIKIIRKY